MKNKGLQTEEKPRRNLKRRTGGDKNGIVRETPKTTKKNETNERKELVS